MWSRVFSKFISPLDKILVCYLVWAFCCMPHAWGLCSPRCFQYLALYKLKILSEPSIFHKYWNYPHKWGKIICSFLHDLCILNMYWSRMRLLEDLSLLMGMFFISLTLQNLLCFPSFILISSFFLIATCLLLMI